MRSTNPSTSLGTSLGVPTPELAATPEDDQLVYELGDWPLAKRRDLEGALTEAGIAWAWESTDLVVRADDEDAVDELIEDFEGEVIDGDEDEWLAYDLIDWDDEQRRAMSAALQTAAVAHTWDPAGTLVVESEAEDVVDELLAALDGDPDALAAEDDDVAGPGTQDVLGELFLAADRLMHDPSSAEAAEGLAEAVPLAAGVAVPYGFAKADWEAIQKGGTALHDAVTADDDADKVIALATELRQVLRSLV